MNCHPTADEVQRTSDGLAILPVGSIEQHGPHLPVTTDWLIADTVGRLLAERIGGFLLPALPINTCREHRGKMGSVWMKYDTLSAVVTDILDSLREQGFRRVVTVQSHGGTLTLWPAVREYNARHPGFSVVNADISGYTKAIQDAGIVETTQELHAGEMETSLMLHIAPQTVHMERAVDFVPAAPRTYLGYGSIFNLSESGVWGSPTRATVEKGRLVLEKMVEIAQKEVEQTFSYMRYNTIHADK